MPPARPVVARRLAAGVLLSVVGLSGCSPSDGDDSAAPPPSTSESTAASPPSSVAAQTASAEAPCPYLDIEVVKETIGQNLSTSIVTTVTPPPGPGPKCDFQRPNGELAASVDTSMAPSPQDAQSAAMAYAQGGNPVDAGEGGSVLVKEGEQQTLLAAYQGTLVVFVVINQESSLEAGLLAEQVLATLA